MGKIIILLILPLLAVIFYLLYINGYLVTSAKRAVLFVGSLRGNKATFSSCTGYMRRIVRFRSSRTYRFLLDAELTKGEIVIELLDAARQQVVRLNSRSSSAAVSVEKGKRYYLVFHFQSASGKYTLSWD